MTARENGISKKNKKEIKTMKEYHKIETLYIDYFPFLYSFKQLDTLPVDIPSSCAI